jgi:large subunit ribosomal protein L30
MAKAKATTDKTAAKAEPKAAPKAEPKAAPKTAEKKGESRMLKATLMKSPIGALPQIRATVQSLGFRRMQQTRELPDNDAVRGMLKAVNFLVAVEGEPYLRPKRGRYKIWRSRSNKKHSRGN